MSGDKDAASEDPRINRNREQLAQAKSVESHMVYELKQRMQYHIYKIMEIQKAIDAVNAVTN